MIARRIGLFLCLAAIALTTVLMGCDDGNSMTSDRTADESALMSDTFALIDVDDAFAKVDDATADAPMGMRPVLGHGPFVRDPRHPHHHGSHLGPILMDLGITDVQLAAIRDLMFDYRETIRPVFEALREANQDILAAANVERGEIVAALRDGEINFVEAIQLLRRLSQDTHDAIRNNPANEPLRAELCEARSDLLDAIRGVLDADQQAVWDAWRSGLGTDCANR